MIKQKRESVNIKRENRESMYGVECPRRPSIYPKVWSYVKITVSFFRRHLYRL